MSRKTVVILLALATGALLELGIGILSGRREAWDAAIYWTRGVPVALVMSLFIGLIGGRGDWLWAAVVVPSQVTTMMVRNGDILGSLGLWPLMVAVTSLLSAPFVGAAYVGFRVRTRWQHRRVLDESASSRN
ncbi:MAG: hypothetical protein AB7J63_15270 [Vicinamibacterales bacterium]